MAVHEHSKRVSLPVLYFDIWDRFNVEGVIFEKIAESVNFARE